MAARIQPLRSCERTVTWTKVTETSSSSKIEEPFYDCRNPLAGDEEEERRSEDERWNGS